MKVKRIMKPFIEDLKCFFDNYQEEDSDEDIFFIMIGDTYIGVDMDNSYWYHEDDGTVVFRVNEV